MNKSLKVSGIALLAALLVTPPASAVSINLGGDGGLVGGGSNSDATATVNTNLLNDSGDDATARINLGNGLLGSGSDPTAAEINLFGTGGQSTDANIMLGGGSDGADGNVLLDLFGASPSSGGNTDARIALGTGGVGTGGVGGNDAALNLFGPADGTGAGDGTGKPGDNNSGGIGSGNGGARTVGTVQIAAATSTPVGGKCFAPTAEQRARLVARHDYSQSTVGWGQVGELKVIDVGLCSDAGASITSQANIAELQSYVSAHPEIKAGLDKLGRSPSEVIAGDKTGGTLTLYVM